MAYNDYLKAMKRFET